MKKQKASVALSILLFSGFMAANVAAYGEEADTEPPSRHTEAVPNSPPNTEADAPISNQAKAKGFIEDSHSTCSGGLLRSTMNSRAPARRTPGCSARRPFSSRVIRAGSSGWARMYRSSAR
ncbi:hypothetical protein [Caballeronia sp. LZ019]|uniref:hypothetical protein n=1 Tax=Caballeronia sp. LZ019 TaxID=3038555 RepID=UPI0028551FD5|nr:hypothetical protein [Caballeronia sp. LZ019]MDR5807900.1 hypothetical protein [Caballeronia sp. LZ019]